MISFNAKRLTLASAVLFGTLLSSACTHQVSRDISADGKAGEVIFPSLDRMVLKDGTFPNIDSLRLVGPGVTKEQLYYLLGRPHFREGMYGVREWDYLFHLRKGDQVVSCQYKVIFDDQYRGQSFHWSPASCADALVQDGAPAVAAAPMPAADAVKRFDLSADALFKFATAEVLPGGREELVRVASQLKQANTQLVQVTGHTDRIGSDASNLALSLRRAHAVRALLIEQGLPAASIFATGVGEEAPVKHCPEDRPREEQISCLQPNRRVEISAFALQ